MKPRRIAILGSGIMGASCALFLARRGVAVDLFDMAAQPFSGASRWNEGKIHLGFIYNADPTLMTAKKVIPGGLLFKPIVEDLLSCSLGSVITSQDDLYLCHSRSVVKPDAMQEYFSRVAGLVRQNPDARRYLADVSQCAPARLSSSGLGTITDSPDIVAGFRIPERSVSTLWIADRFVGALQAEPAIRLLAEQRILAARPCSEGCFDGPWHVRSSTGDFGPYDYVINALWQGRLAVDQSIGMKPSGIWSHRYRQSIFLRTRKEVDLPCVLVATGPYGDIKNYNRRDFYLSWYPEGLRIDSSAIEPPDPARLNPEAVQRKCDVIFDRLEAFIPMARALRENIESLSLEGGWVFAAGQGALSDPASTLHRRKDFGLFRRGRYLSIDTGKYSTAPWLANALVEEIIDGVS